MIYQPDRLRRFGARFQDYKVVVLQEPAVTFYPTFLVTQKGWSG
jgi:hypothetical protein